MAIENSNALGSGDLSLPKEVLEKEVQSGVKIEEIILDFFNNPPDIPRRRYVVARNQILSLHKRMGYHPENIALCQFYKNRIKQIIKLEKGKEK